MTVDQGSVVPKTYFTASLRRRLKRCSIDVWLKACVFCRSRDEEQCQLIVSKKGSFKKALQKRY